MIGDDFLHLRAQLGASIFSLTSLAHDLDADPQIFGALHDLGDGLREPLLLVALGDTGAGKSSLLNALFGRDFCQADGQAAGKIRLHTFDSETGDDGDGVFVECRRPHGFLRDFQVIDTPGTDALKPEHWAVLERYLPAADAVLLVLSVTNPWAATAWAAAESLAKQWPEKIVFVLQQADHRAAVEVAAVVRHVEQTVIEKLGINRPVFAVSAKDALLAKTTGTDKARLLAGSRIESLEAFLNKAISSGEAGTGRLRATLRAAGKTLTAVGRKTREAVLSLKKENDRLTALQHKLEDRKEQSLRGVGGALWTLAQTCETAQKRGEELLQQRLSIFSVLRQVFRGAHWEDGIRDEVEVRLREALGKQVGNSVDLLQSDLKNVWQELCDSLGKSFGHESFQAPDFTRQRENLIKCIEAGLEPHLSAQQLEIELPLLLHQMAAWLRAPLGFAFASGAATLAAVLAGITIAPLLGAATVAAAVFGMLMAAAKRNKLLAVFRETMIRKREAMLAPIEDHMRHSIDVFYKALPGTFELLQGFCLTQQKIYEPLFTRVQQLDGMFASIDRELGTGPLSKGS